ncbi:uncharacterized protein LOC113312563 [Papaver somniferum]|uniref:uncharacterized protein LOC113312563 n=1 Tax=Papaver somniferum TaxID=3469 RepID=UPI000E70447B|nr:uncharacterized protein LOC113312563 [Papaver somniferum]
MGVRGTSLSDSGKHANSSTDRRNYDDTLLKLHKGTGMQNFGSGFSSGFKIFGVGSNTSSEIGSGSGQTSGSDNIPNPISVGPIHFGIPVPGSNEIYREDRLKLAKRMTQSPQCNAPYQNPSETRHRAHQQSHQPSSDTHTNLLHNYFIPLYAQTLSNALDVPHTIVSMVITKVNEVPPAKVTHNQIQVPEPAPEPQPPQPSQPSEPSPQLHTYKRREQHPRKVLPKHLNLPSTPDFAAPPPPPKARKFLSLTTLQPESTRSFTPQYEVLTTRSRKEAATTTTQQHSNSEDKGKKPSGQQEGTRKQQPTSPAWQLYLEDEETDVEDASSSKRASGKSQSSHQK